jgi:hypothetical protein
VALLVVMASYVVALFLGLCVGTGLHRGTAGAGALLQLVVVLVRVRGGYLRQLVD